MQERRKGFVDVYNHVHNNNDKSADISNLRILQLEMDNAVSAAYGWNNIDLGHGFQETKHGIRFTISKPARRIILDRLLALNHERYEEEVKAGLHEKKAAKGSGKGREKKSSPEKKKAQYEIFEE
jgi:hypothetical protein